MTNNPDGTKSLLKDIANPPNPPLVVLFLGAADLCSTFDPKLGNCLLFGVPKSLPE